MKKSVFVLCIFIAVTSQARPRAFRTRSAWQAPTCTTIQGLDSMRFMAEPGMVRRSTGQTVNIHATAIAASTSEPNVLYAVFEGGIYESRDAGCNWSPASSMHLRGIAYNGEGYDSIDGGATWTLFGKAPDFLPYGMDDRDLARRSERDGKTFTRLAKEPEISLAGGGRLAPHPREPRLVAVGSNTVEVFTDEGLAVQLPQPGYALAWSPIGTLYFSAPDAQIRY